MYKINYSRVKTFWESKLKSKNKNYNDMKKRLILIFYCFVYSMKQTYVFLIYIAHLDIILITDYKYLISFWFINYTKAFDNVQHKNLFEPPVEIIYLWKIIWSIYWEQTACIEIENELNKYRIKKSEHKNVCSGFNTLYSKVIQWEFIV